MVRRTGKQLKKNLSDACFCIRVTFFFEVDACFCICTWHLFLRSTDFNFRRYGEKLVWTVRFPDLHYSQVVVEMYTGHWVIWYTFQLVLQCKYCKLLNKLLIVHALTTTIQINNSKWYSLYRMLCCTTTTVVITNLL